MEQLNELQIAKSYEGKPYITANLRRIAMGYGDSDVVVYYGRLSKTYFDLFGITEANLDEWTSNDIFFSIFITLDESTETIKDCKIAKTIEDDVLQPSQEEIQIFKRIMDYITKG